MPPGDGLRFALASGEGKWIELAQHRKNAQSESGWDADGEGVGSGIDLENSAARRRREEDVSKEV